MGPRFLFDLQTTRINNISLFVTVLSACLLAVGAPVLETCAQPAPAARLFSVSNEQRQGLDEAAPEDEGLLYHIAFIRPPAEFPSDHGAFAPAITENTRALNKNQSLAVVTRLARAALDS